MTLAGTFLSGPAPTAGAQSGDGPFPVRVTSQTFVDSSRSTPARSGVAAHAGRTIHELIYQPTGPTGVLPTVVFAPGWDNDAAGYDPLLRVLASSGYLVLGVDSPGTSDYFPGTPTTRDLSNNIIDLMAALSAVEAGPLGPLVDRDEVAAVGQSDGGSEVAALALGSAYQTSRLRAYAVLSGDVPSGDVAGGFAADNNGPVLAMIGTDDEYGNYTPFPGGGGTQGVYAAAGPTKILVTMAGASHLSAYIGASEQADDTRDAIREFLDATVRDEPGARYGFDSDTSEDGLSVQSDLAPSWFESPVVVGMAPTADGRGYWIASSDGTVDNFGDAAALGSLPSGGTAVVAIVGTHTGRGYWLVDSSGVVHPFGDAAFHGDLSGRHLAAPIVAMATDPATGGYWLLGGDGGVFSFDAPFYGSTGGIHLSEPAVGMAATPTGNGYFFVASDGGVFSFGGARFAGSTGNVRLNRPVVGMAVDPVTGGYWLDASDGGIFAFDAPFEGSTGSVRLVEPCVSMAPAPGRPGYWLVAADGGVFAFNAAYEGSDA